MICPYCNAAEISGREGVFDLGAKLAGETRIAIEARARGLSLRDTAQTIVAGERWTGGASGRACPYCRRARVSSNSDSLLIIDLLVLVLGGARRYANAGGWRLLTARETGQLVLDGRISNRVSPSAWQPDEEEPDEEEPDEEEPDEEEPDEEEPDEEEHGELARTRVQPIVEIMRDEEDWN